jgi:hypothetical protein
MSLASRIVDDVDDAARATRAFSAESEAVLGALTSHDARAMLRIARSQPEPTNVLDLVAMLTVMRRLERAAGRE